MNEFQNLGIQLKEIAALLFVPETTLRTWFTRKSTIPPAHYGYISGLEIYQQKQIAEDLKTIYNQWETNNRALLENQKTKALRELRVFEQKNNLALDKLKLKETRLLQRLHLSEHYHDTFVSICKRPKILFRGATCYIAKALLILAMLVLRFKN